MHVLVIHQAVTEEATVDERDVYDQRDAILSSLSRLNHSSSVFPVTLDAAALQTAIQEQAPDVVVNLVESLGQSDRLITIVPALLEAWNIPFTGVGAEGIWTTTNKLRAKRTYHRLGLPTLPWWEAGRLHGSTDQLIWPARWIRKPVWEHASFGMNDEAVIACDNEAMLAQCVREWESRLNRPCFAEPYVHGREFNLSVLGGRSEPEVLRPAEIIFENYPEGKPRIVGYSAKWTENSFEYDGTPRRFDFPESDRALLEHLQALSARCWREVGLRGYARVDFRVDEHNQPWILEINANPCFAPWSGFTAAVEASGYTYDQALERLLIDALKARGQI